MGAGQSDLTNLRDGEDAVSRKPAGSITGLEDPIIMEERERNKNGDFSSEPRIAAAMFSKPQIRAMAWGSRRVLVGTMEENA